MRYTMFSVFDQKNQYTGLFGLNTSKGFIVVIFQNQAKMDTFGQLIAPMVKKEGKKLGVASKEAASISQVVRELLEVDPSIEGTHFISDSDPLYAQIIDMLGG